MKPDTPHILFVNPWIHDFAAYDFWAKPLGLLRLAALAKGAGAAVSYIDCLDRFHPRAGKPPKHSRAGRGPFLKTPIEKPGVFGDVPRVYSRYGIEPEWFETDLKALPRPDLVAVTSMMTYWYPGVQETIRSVRKVFPDVPLVLGGIYATLCADHARKHIDADRVIEGPGEVRLFELLNRFTGWSPDLRQIGLLPEDINRQPFPALDLQHRIEYVPLLTAVGCPFNCPYCASHLLHAGMTRRNPESAAQEVRYWKEKYGVTDFALYDDAFLYEADRHAVPFLKAVIASNTVARFHTPNALHARWITQNTADLMFRAGFKTVRIGLETIDENDRQSIDAKLTHKEFLRAADCLKRAGFTAKQVGAYLLAGLPGTADSAVEAAIELVKANGITPVVAYYTPIPGTAMWGEAAAASRYDLASDPLLTNNAVLPCRKAPFSWQVITRLKMRAAT